MSLSLPSNFSQTHLQHIAMPKPIIFFCPTLTEAILAQISNYSANIYLVCPVLPQISLPSHITPVNYRTLLHVASGYTLTNQLPHIYHDAVSQILLLTNLAPFSFNLILYQPWFPLHSSFLTNTKSTPNRIVLTTLPQVNFTSPEYMEFFLQSLILHNYNLKSPPFSSYSSLEDAYNTNISLNLQFTRK